MTRLGISSRLESISTVAVVILIGLTTVVLADDPSRLPQPSTSTVNPKTTVSQEPTTVNTTAASTAAVTKETSTLPPIIITNRPLLGRNGTGQLWANVSNTRPQVVSEPIFPASDANSSAASGPKFPTSPPTASIPKATTWDPPASSSWEDQYVNADNVDVENPELTEEQLRQKNLTLGHEEHHLYYNSSTIRSAVTAQEYLNSFKNLTINSLLSKSHRRAVTVKLTFQFPFYGHFLDNVTVATGGFIYTGDYVHSWLAATQFIAPLMANFDTSLSNDSFVKYYDNGTAFTVLWDNVQLHGHEKQSGFTFSATLHQSGDIVFGYYNIPMSIDAIEDQKHPVKVGLSDAYLFEKTVFYAKRKALYEYHKLNFEGVPISSNTIIFLKPEPTCNIMQNCADCTSLTTFKCGWCPTLKRCSTGTDRKRNDWLLKGCDKAQVVKESECANPEYVTRQLIRTTDTGLNPTAGARNQGNSGSTVEEEEKGDVGTVIGVFITFGLIFVAVGWVAYAYRNPHTKSGQFLIQYRPSQWSWRRGEARYTAATIHM